VSSPRRTCVLGLAPLSGTMWVGLGSVLLGASGYAFLTLTARTVPPADYAALASLYLLVALAGPALFIPVEQETTRLVSRWRALGLGTADVVRRLALASSAMTAVAVLVLAALGPLLVSRVFNGSVALLAALTLSVAGYGGACLVRGVFAGQNRLRGYAACVGVDGLMRLVPCVGLAIAGVSAAWPYGLALGLGSVAALGVGLARYRPGGPGPTVAWRELLAAVGWLIAAWGMLFALANIAPVIVTALLPDDPAQAGVFAFVFVVARVPVFVLLSLQAILLPALSRSAATRDLPGLRRGVLRAMLAVGGLGVVSLLTTVPVARWLVGILFDGQGAGGQGAGGQGARGQGLEGLGALSAWTLTLLAVGTILAMVVQVLQPALIAVAGHRVVAAAWLAGAGCFAAAFALPLEPVAAATVAQVVSAAATVAVMALALVRQLRTASLTPVQAAA
jgi:O-antigen/teichoic acid export membrane protein